MNFVSKPTYERIPLKYLKFSSNELISLTTDLSNKEKWPTFCGIFMSEIFFCNKKYSYR